MYKHFTKEEIQELSMIFGISPVEITSDELPVRDGYVKKEDSVWWLGDKGPVETIAKLDWDNIRQYPQYYSIEEPEIKKVEYYD